MTSRRRAWSKPWPRSSSGASGCFEGPARAALIEALVTGAEPVFIRSAFELPAAELGAIRQALVELGAPPERLRFETAPELVGGIELTTNGQKLAWSIAEYLRSLEQSVGEVIAEQLKAPVAATAAPGLLHEELP